MNAMIVLIIINTIIFTCLSVLHFYWAFGGKSFRGAVLPTNKEGKKTLNPGMVATLIVAVGLAACALITVGNSGAFDKLIPAKLIHYATYCISVIFFLRAMGDFKYVGYFKRVKGTAFARQDTRIYSPLCLIISMSSFVIAFSN